LQPTVFALSDAARSNPSCAEEAMLAMMIQAGNRSSLSLVNRLRYRRIADALHAPGKALRAVHSLPIEEGLDEYLRREVDRLQELHCIGSSRSDPAIANDTSMEGRRWMPSMVRKGTILRFF
jgi:hypothetical protein